MEKNKGLLTLTIAGSCAICSVVLTAAYLIWTRRLNKEFEKHLKIQTFADRRKIIREKWQRNMIQHQRADA